MKISLLSLLFIITMSASGCAIFQKAEIIRRQNVRSAATRYATGNWVERRDAVEEIIRYYGPEKNDLILGTVLVALQDQAGMVRIEALKGLAKLKLEITFPIIEKIALEERDTNVRWYAIRALRGFKNPSAADVFIKGMESEEWLIREESARGMVMMDAAVIQSRLIPHIIGAIHDRHLNVSAAALRGLKINDARLYPAIAEKFNACTENNYTLLNASLRALRGYRLDEKTREKLVNLLVHPNRNIRVLALRVLKKEKSLTKTDDQRLKR